MTLPTISVVIPLYNKANHILNTLQSVLKQTVPAMEIIVVNDGSTDDGALRVERANLPRVTVINRKNQGVSAARNIGIAKASGDYVAFLDADDQWSPLFLQEMCGLIERFPYAGMYASRYQCVEPGNKFVDAKIALDKVDPKGMLLNNYFEIASQGDLPFMMSCSVVQRSLVAKVGGFRVGEIMGEDQDFFARVALKSSIAYSPNIHLMYHRDTDNRACQNYVPKQECPFSRRLHHLVKKGVVKGKLAKDINRYSAAHLVHIAKLNALKGRREVAQRILQDPRCKLRPKQFAKAWLLANFGGIMSVAA